jgi:hypothetical protein
LNAVQIAELLVAKNLVKPAALLAWSYDSDPVEGS